MYPPTGWLLTNHLPSYYILCYTLGPQVWVKSNSHRMLLYFGNGYMSRCLSPACCEVRLELGYEVAAAFNTGSNHFSWKCDAEGVSIADMPTRGQTNYYSAPNQRSMKSNLLQCAHYGLLIFGRICSTVKAPPVAKTCMNMLYAWKYYLNQS